MSNQYLKLRRSAIPGKIPETSSIDFGEIALNTYDGLAFIKKSGSLGEEIVTIGASNIVGSSNFIPIFSGSTSLVTSSIYQSGSYTSIRNSTGPEDPANPDILYINGEGVDTYNLISAHGDLDDYVQVNVQNYSVGGNASSDIVATKDDGTPEYGYINMGINGSQYSNGSLVGTNSDAYLYSLSNGNLLIGNAEAGKQIIIFNGGLDAQTNSRIWIHDQGTVGINTAYYNDVNPPSLQIAAANSTTYNLIQAKADTDNYLQTAITNANAGVNASSDMVAYNNIDPVTQSRGFIDVGINSTNFSDPVNYPGWQGGDSYVFSDAPRLTIGGATSSAEINLYVGGVNPNTNSKLILRSNNIHSITGSLRVTGSITALSFTGSLLGTSSYAITASYWSGSILNATSASYAATAALAPAYVLNSSTASMLTPYVLTSVTSSMLSPYVLSSNTGSFVTNNQTGSFITNSQTSSMSVATASFVTSSKVFGPYGANSILSSSYALSASYWSGSILNSTSASYAATAALAPNYVLNSSTASMLTPYVLTSVTSSMTVLSASYAATAALAPAYVLNSSTSSMLLPYVLTSVTSSMIVLSASFAATTSLAPNYVLNSSTSSMLTPYVLTSITASMLSPYVLSSNTGSFVTNSQTSSMSVLSASFASTASLAPAYVLNSSTASMLSPYVLSSNTASFITNSQTSSMSVLSASFASTASSAENFTVRGTLTAQTIVVQTITSSVDFVTGSTRFGSLLANTHQFTGSVSITGSLTLPYLSAGSVLFTGTTDNIAEDNTNLFWDNTNKRLGIGINTFDANTKVTIFENYTAGASTGLRVKGAGSSAGSWKGRIVAGGDTVAFLMGEYLSQAWLGGHNAALNAWAPLRINPDGTTDLYLGNTSTAGSNPIITIRNSTGNVTIGSGADAAYRLDVNGTFRANGNSEITGSLKVTQGITGSLFGTSSWANNALTSSYVLNAISSSYAATAALAPNYVLNASTSSMLLPYVLTSVTASMTVATASYVLNSISSSYAATAALAPNYVLNSSTSSMLLPYVLTLITSSMSVATASYVLNSISASYSATTSLAPNYVLTSVTSSMSVATASYAVTSSLPLRGLITGSVAGSTITFTKGDGTTFDLTIAQSGTVSTASYVTSSGVFGPYGANSIVTASYALTASYVANASSFPYTGSAIITGSFTVTGSTNIQSLNVGSSQFNNTSSVTTAGTTVISQLATGSYTSCFYNYTIASASNARSGQIMSVWNGATVRYTEVTTTDIGNTATASFAVALSGANVQLNFTAPGSWTVKNISNLL